MLSKRPAVSEKQLLANRANARRNTGPTTGAGKARASDNSVKHGLTAKRLVIADEDPVQFRREELDKIANEILRKFGGAVPKEPKKKRRVAARLFRKSESR